MAFIEPVSCVQCGHSFTYERKRRPRKFCSPKCRSEAGNRRNGAKPIEVEKARRKAMAKTQRECKSCGSCFIPRGSKDATCGAECRAALRASKAQAVASRRQVDRLAAEARRKARLTERPAKPTGKTCRGCGIPVSKGAQRCEPCREIANKVRKSSATTRANKAAAKVRRRLRVRQARVERFDPIAVLERDGWSCYICGIETPMFKRGTHEPDAPEVDHVIPLAVGGEHSMANCRCACRSCNGLKADSVEFERAA